MSTNEHESTDRLLRVIISLLLRQKKEDTLNLKQQIEILNDLGLKPLEIAEILGRSNIYINKEIYKLRNVKK